jgi:hypothetical protein
VKSAASKRKQARLTTARLVLSLIDRHKRIDGLVLVYFQHGNPPR